MIAGMDRAEKSTIGAEFGRLAVAFGRAGRGALAKNSLEGLAAAVNHGRECAALGVAVEYARQQVIDGDVARRRLPREAGGETDQAGARAVRQAKLDPAGFSRCATRY